VAVVVTAVSGYDLGYVWKGQGATAAPERSAGGYRRFRSSHSAISSSAR
jgi:hypothetical protein